MDKGRVLGLALGCLFLAGCKPPAPAVPEPPPVRLAIEPPGATVTAGRQRTFQCAVTDGPGEVPVWKVLEPEGGTVDDLGRYRAALVPGVYTLQAGLVSGRASASARITVVAPPAGNISAPARVVRQATGLKASVPAVAGSTYAWTVQGGRILEGAATEAITFEAGEERLLLLTCKVTNLAGDALNSTLELPVAARQSLAIRPVAAVLTVGGSMQFGFDLLGGPSTEVLWQVGSPEGGKVDEHGNYDAPNCPGQFEVKVISRDEPGVAAAARVQVVAAPTGVIAAPASVTAGEAHLAASISPQEGMAYAWEITGGTLTDGARTPTVTFQAGPGPKLTLHCTLQNQAGDTLRLSRTLIVGEGGR